MDLASIIGLLMCFAMFIYGIISSGGIAALPGYWDWPSVWITIGGSFFAVLTSFSVSDYIAGLKSFRIVLRSPEFNIPDIITKVIELSNVARKEGLLALESAATELDDPFLKKGLLLIVDGTDPELVRAIMETELVSIDDRHKNRVSFWETLAAMGPAWGMIGTLVGLIYMLGNMEDASTIGPAMSVALVTTLYGSLLANWFAIPVSNKLKAVNSYEMTAKEITVEGLLSIQAGENPRVIEEKLKSFLAPKDRVGQEEQLPGGEV